jgi:hypothetical protein
VNGILLWLIRYGHLLSATAWVGSYTVFIFILIPFIRRETSPTLLRFGMSSVRVMTYGGTATIVFGLLLVTRTRGFASIGRGEWGIIIAVCMAIAVALLGIRDGALRPRRMLAGEPAGSLGRIALVGLVLSIIAVGLMTRALYAGN